MQVLQGEKSSLSSTAMFSAKHQAMNLTFAEKDDILYKK